MKVLLRKLTLIYSSNIQKADVFLTRLIHSNIIHYPLSSLDWFKHYFILLCTINIMINEFSLDFWERLRCVHWGWVAVFICWTLNNRRLKSVTYLVKSRQCGLFWGDFPTPFPPFQVHFFRLSLLQITWTILITMSLCMFSENSCFNTLIIQSDNLVWPMTPIPHKDPFGLPSIALSRTLPLNIFLAGKHHFTEMNESLCYQSYACLTIAALRAVLLDHLAWVRCSVDRPELLSTFIFRI